VSARVERRTVDEDSRKHVLAAVNREFKEWIMRKQGWIIIASVLVLAAGAQASIGWAQNFAVGAVNQVDWLGGIGSAAAVNKASYDQRQFGSTYASAGVSQRNSGTIFQNAAASGLIGPSTSRQTADIKGGQALWTSGGRFPQARGLQSLEGTFTNLIVKPEGIGKVDGIQHFVGSQEQGVTTSYGNGTQSQYVEVLQRGNITTGVDTDPTITSTVNLQLNQSQISGGL
jgi:hypothetical protein